MFAESWNSVPLTRACPCVAVLAVILRLHVPRAESFDLLRAALHQDSECFAYFLVPLLQLASLLAFVGVAC